MLVFLGIVLVMGGAILTFAIESGVDGVDLGAIGWILMGGGALALIAAAVSYAGWMSMGNKRYTAERHVSPDGQHVAEEVRVS